MGKSQMTQTQQASLDLLGAGVSETELQEIDGLAEKVSEERMTEIRRTGLNNPIHAVQALRAEVERS